MVFPPSPTVAAPSLSFTLNDQFGTRWTADSLSGRWTVLLAGERRHADAMTAWSDSLHHHFAGDSTAAQWFMVADLRSVPRVMRRLASQRAPREAHRRLLMDHDGRIASQLLLRRESFSVVVLSPTGAVALRLIDSSVSSQHLSAVREAMGKR